MTSMTKHILVCKNTTGKRGRDVEEKSSASERKTETVGKPTGKATDTQNVQDVTETVTEERVVEEISPNTPDSTPSDPNFALTFFRDSPSCSGDRVTFTASDIKGHVIKVICDIKG